MSTKMTAVAARIADYLFTNGAGQKAKRLVLELEENGMYGGGWCRQAVVNAVERILKETPHA